MRKTLQDVASYLKETMVPETHEAYAIDTAYTHVADEGTIREGVLALRVFLARLYDAVYATGNTYDLGKKVAHEYENRITLSGYYPYLHNVSIILLKIGYYGRLDEASQSLTCDHTIFYGKQTTAKNLACLELLAACGMGIEGIDLMDRKQDLSAINCLKIAYPDDPKMLIGLKIMAIAEIDHGTLVNQDVLLRCDYRALKKDKTDELSIVMDTIKPLSEEIQTFILCLHQRYMSKGLTCVVEIKGYHIYIKYCYKRKDVWGINASLRNGYHINVKSTKMEEYPDTIHSLAPVLQELIAKGYGCGRKRAIGHCDGGCRGLPIMLDDTILDIRDDILTWFDQEVHCLQAK